MGSQSWTWIERISLSPVYLSLEEKRGGQALRGVFSGSEDFRGSEPNFLSGVRRYTKREKR